MVMPTHGSAIGKLLDNGLMTPEKRLEIAHLVMQMRGDYGRPTFPERPAALALEDYDVIDAYQIWESGAQPGADKRRALKLFGAWRCAVRQVEAHAGMSLLCLVDAARTYEEHHLGDEADVLLTIAEEEYPGFKRGECPDLPWDGLREWCLKKGRDYALLPAYMRSMKPPRSGTPFHKPQGQRAEPPVEDDTPEQDKMPWD